MHKVFLTIRDDCGFSWHIVTYTDRIITVMAGLLLLMSHPALNFHNLLTGCVILLENILINGFI
jgi:hypothetical protein